MADGLQALVSRNGKILLSGLVKNFSVCVVLLKVLYKDRLLPVEKDFRTIKSFHIIYLFFCFRTTAFI